MYCQTYLVKYPSKILKNEKIENFEESHFRVTVISLCPEEIRVQRDTLNIVGEVSISTNVDFSP